MSIARWLTCTSTSLGMTSSTIALVLLLDLGNEMTECLGCCIGGLNLIDADIVTIACAYFDCEGWGLSVSAPQVVE